MGLRVESVAGLSVFVRAADSGSFKLAGQQCGLSSSAVGKAIVRLEEQLGVQLFHRSTRSIGLTREGELFLERCRCVLSELEAGEAELARATARPRGPLRIGLPVAGELLAGLLGAFMEAHPEIELDLHCDERFADVIEEGFDAVIRTGEPGDSRLMHARLGDFAWRLVAAPAYLARFGVPEDAAGLATHRLLHHRFAETGKLGPWGLDLPDGVTLPVTLAATTIGPLVRLAEAGHGVALLPGFAVRDQMAAGSLREVLPGVPKRRGTLRLLWPRSRFPLPRVAAFVSFMCARTAAVLTERS